MQSVVKAVAMARKAAKKIRSIEKQLVAHGSTEEQLVLAMEDIRMFSKVIAKEMTAAAKTVRSLTPKVEAYEGELEKLASGV